MLNVVYSNDMVQLAAQLADIQQSEPLPPLQAETIIVQSNELARWLSLYLANQHGIASHLEFPYPSAYIWSLFRQIWPDVPAQSPFSKEPLAWRLFQLLPECKDEVGFEPIQHYLAGADDVVKRFNLAHRIADSFDQYLMYRPDWVQQWEQAASEASLPHWQARLWHKLTRDDDTAKHRANLLQQLHDVLANAETKLDCLPSRLSIIGITALPPVYLSLFELMAKHCDITLYFLSPSEAYWGDLLDLKQQAKQRSLFDDAESDDDDHIGHPLLASLGKQGQDFFEQLQTCQHESSNMFVAPEFDSLLGHLKHDIYSLVDIDHLAEKAAIDADDNSIQVHSCHSTTREVEVLHDQLLVMLETDESLSPTDMVVMTPDIERYAAAIDAVFASSETQLPYSIADCGVSYQNQLISTFISVLNLPQSRFDVETVLALLQNPAVQQRFKLDEEAVVIIRSWLHDTHTRWGLDGKDKQRFDLPANEANTWRAGLDRLLLAYALPQANQAGGLFENKLSFDAISGERAAIMAQLCAFIDNLDCCRQRLSKAKTAQQWQQNLNDVIDDLFLLTSEQQQFERELNTLRHTIEQFVDSASLAEFDALVEPELMQDWLNRHLDSEQNESRFMGHGITFCGMVPMRSIPFDVVCLIGMNDESYPRRQPKLGFDLLANDFRLGDRSRREDDRYLFLEAILSAQRTLYISYVGASIHDNAAIPPSVLVSDLRDVLNLSYCSESQDELWSQLFTQHPLQAFSRRYFDGSDSNLFSYQQHNCPQQSDQQQIAAWFEQPLAEADPEWRQVSIQQLVQFFRHPVRYLLTERLGLRLDLNDDQLDTREPFQLDGLQAWQLRQQLLGASLEKSSTADIYDYVQASGVLPQGAMGEHIFEQQQNQVTRFAETLLSHYPDEIIDTELVDLKIGDFHINGQLQGLSTKGLFFYRMAKTKGSDLLNAWLHHLILNCVKPVGVLLQTELITEDNHYQFKPLSDAESHLQQLLNLYWQGLHEPLPLFNNTSFAYAKAALNEKSRANPDNAMWVAWLGGQFANGEAEDIYHQQVFVEPPLDDSFKQMAENVYQPIQTQLMESTL